MKQPDASESIVLAKKSDRIVLRAGTWGVNFNPANKSLEIFRANRSELAHLSIFFKTVLHVHLTFRHEAKMAGLQEKKREVLLVLDPATVEAAGHRYEEEVVQRVMKKYVLGRYRKFRPGWLARNGYVVWIGHADVALDWFKTFGKRQGRRIEVDPELKTKLESPPLAIAEHFYHPEALHLLHLEELRKEMMGDPNAMIQAVRSRPNGRGDERMFLHLMKGRDGKVGWYGLPEDELEAMSRALTMHTFDLLVPMVRPEHVEKFESIVAGLGIDENEEGQRFASKVREFLRAPRNPIRQPYARMKVGRRR